MWSVNFGDLIVGAACIIHPEITKSQVSTRLYVNEQEMYKPRGENCDKKNRVLQFRLLKMCELESVGIILAPALT